MVQSVPGSRPLPFTTINAIKAHNPGRITTVQSINSGCPFKEQADKALAYCRSHGVRGMKSPTPTGNGCRDSQCCWQCQTRTVEAGAGPLQRQGCIFPGQTSVLCLLEISTAMRSGSSRVRITQHPWSLWPFSRQSETGCLSQLLCTESQELVSRAGDVIMERSLQGERPRCAQPRAQMPHQLHCHWGQEHHGDPALPFLLSPPLIHLALSPFTLSLWPNPLLCAHPTHDLQTNFPAKCVVY